MKKNLIYGAILLGLGGFYAYDTYYPKYVYWGTEIQELQEKISSARATAPRLAEMRDEEAVLRERLLSSLEKLPSAAELSDLLVMVIPVFERVGITSDRIATKNVGAAVEKDVYREHPIQIGGIKGLSMETIVRLLFELRTFHRIVNVSSFNFNRTGPNEYDLNLNIVTYSYIAGEGEDLGEAPVPVPAAPEEPVESEETTGEEADTATVEAGVAGEGEATE